MKVNGIDKMNVMPVEIRSTGLSEKRAEQKVPDSDNASKALEAERLRSQIEGDVRSVSDDGDELRVSSTAAKMETDQAAAFSKSAVKEAGNDDESRVVTANDDGVVTQINASLGSDQAVSDQTETVAEADEEEMITDLTGYSMSQIETLYYQGRVSRYDYEQEIKDQEALDEELGIGVTAIQNEAAETDQTTPAEATESEDQIKTAQVQNGTGVNSEDSDKSEQNRAALSDVKDNSSEMTAETIDRDKAAANKLGQVAAKQTNDQIKAQALVTAGENDRTDMMISIFDKGNT